MYQKLKDYHCKNNDSLTNEQLLKLYCSTDDDLSKKLIEKRIIAQNIDLISKLVHRLSKGMCQDDKDDLFQEAYIITLSVIRKFDVYRNVHFTAYLYKYLYFEIVKKIKKEQKYINATTDINESIISDNYIQDPYENEIEYLDISHIKKYLKLLSPRERQIIYCFFFSKNQKQQLYRIKKRWKINKERMNQIKRDVLARMKKEFK